MNGILKVYKIGGNVIDDEANLSRFLADFTSLKGKKVLIHGGGKIASSLAGKLGVESNMIEGRRVTSAAMRDIAVMVYSGLINRNIVARLNALGNPSVGVSGADAMAVKAIRRSPVPIDYGCVGDVTEVNSSYIELLLEQGITPVFCAISCDGNGELLNTNADTIAMEVARAMSVRYEVELTYLFEKNGVLRIPDDEDSIIDSINRDEFELYVEEGVIAGGMIPKVRNALELVENSAVKTVMIKNAVHIADNTGTKILKGRVPHNKS